MDNEISEIINNTNFGTELGMNMDIKAFFSVNEYIEQYKIQVIDDIYIINVKLKQYSVQQAKKSFDEFFKFIKYDYLNLCLTENNENIYHVKYWTVNHKKNGVRFKVSYN